MDAADACPCGGRPRGVSYGACCGRWHAGAQHLQAPDAEALMRSRYSAFVCGDAEYLLATWHPSTRPPTLELEPQLRWLGLEVKSFQALNADQATVQFVARCRASSGRAQRIAETSRFQREAGRWFYVDGNSA
jgi:SEC-C motif domain protein